MRQTLGSIGSGGRPPPLIQMQPMVRARAAGRPLGGRWSTETPPHVADFGFNWFRRPAAPADSNSMNGLHSCHGPPARERRTAKTPQHTEDFGFNYLWRPPGSGDLDRVTAHTRATAHPLGARRTARTPTHTAPFPAQKNIHEERDRTTMAPEMATDPKRCDIM